tara:strand:- start:21502 stop:24876 length:3375 start_codon:yes stop_codon:yes gene_type:complete
MAKKKKNKNSQTFDVYPYLDQYQYLMKTGGALPWYQTRGPVEEGAQPTKEDFGWDYEKAGDSEFEQFDGFPSSKQQEAYNKALSDWQNTNKKRTYTVEGVEYDTYEEFVKAWNEKSPGINPPPKEYLDKQFDEELVDNTTPPTENTDELDAKVKPVNGDCPEGYTLEPTTQTCILTENFTPNGENLDDKEEVVTKPVDIEKSQLEQLQQDYNDGKISRRELDDATKRYNTSGKRGDGYKTGNTEFETAPGSAWNLLGNAVKSTSKFANNIGKNQINPKTGKPYEKSDFRSNSIDWSNMSNENKANIYFDKDNLQKFTDGRGDDLTLSELFKTKTTNDAENFNEHQADQSNRAKEAGHESLFSEQTRSRYDGSTSYNDITEDIETEVSNPEYDEAVKILKTRGETIEGNAELEGIPKTITKTESSTRAHTSDDLTEGDIAMDNLKDNSTTEIIFDENSQPVQYKGWGSDGSGEGSTGTWDYDKDKKYGDWEETITINNQEGKNNRRKGLNADGTDPNAVVPSEDNGDGPAEVSRVTNEDFSVTITYDDGTEKTMEESSQAGKNRRAKTPEGKMGLETFVYGGQPSRGKLSINDMYAKGGEALRKYLEGDEIDDAVENLELDEEVIVPEEEAVVPEDFTDDSINFTEEEINTMDEETLGETDLVKTESTYGKGTQGLKNWWGATTKAGTSGKVARSYADLGQAGTDWADFGNAGMNTWSRDASEAKAENEGNDAQSMFTVQESNQGIHDVNSGDAWTNKKVDEIYAGNTMKAPLIMRTGGNTNKNHPVIPPTNEQAIASAGTLNETSSLASLQHGRWYRPEVWENMKDEWGGRFEYLTNSNIPPKNVKSLGTDPLKLLLDKYLPKDTKEMGGSAGNPQLKYQTGGMHNQMAQQAPVEEEINYAALSQFGDNNTWDSEISYSPEVIAYQKQIMGKMRDGGSLPMGKDGWWDGLKDSASNLYDSAKETYDNTDFKTPINNALDYSQTAMSGVGMIPIVGNAVDLVNAGVSGARAGYAGYTGDTEGVKDHTENAALNLASAVPIAGQVAGGLALAKDTAKYTGVMDGSVSTNIANAITPNNKPQGTQVAENTNDVKINKVARDGGEQELEVDYELLQELIKAGADIEII